MNKNTNEWIGWWKVWLRRRDVEEYRSWAGWKYKRIPLSLNRPIDNTGDEVGEYLLPATLFEDELLDILDFRIAWPLLSSKRRLILLLTAEGLNDIQIGRILNTTQNSIAQQKRVARRILQKACKVRY
jgi:DNA-directed RNA polymerase specialized sigma24 family protein